MSTKARWVWFSVTLGLVVAAYGAIPFVRGIRPAFFPAAEPIEELIRNATVSNTNAQPEALGPGTNATTFPLSIPDGYGLSVFASDLSSPRVLVRDPSGTLIVSDPGTDRVLALPDIDTDGVADSVIVVAEGLRHPHGLAFRCSSESCDLFIAEEDEVGRWRYDAASRTASGKQHVLALPSGAGHSTRTLLFHPDGRLLVSIGSSCNVCNEEEAYRATIVSVNPDGTDAKVFATGLRNSVFLRVRPDTSEIWATDMGRDLLGDDLPPDELNIVSEGGEYGWPYCFGTRIQDTKFDASASIADRCSGTEAPRIEFPAHSAPLGLAFLDGEAWPLEYRGDLLVAFHGSWNRTTPTGYKIVRYDLTHGTPALEGDFISGWLTSSGGALGRPVDLLPDDTGNIFISDDKAGVIYLLKLGA